MEKNVLNQKIQQAEEELFRLQNDLCAVGRTNPLLYPENYSELATAAALRSERLTCALRQLASFPPPRRLHYLTKAVTAHGISVSIHDGILTIVLPCLLPKRQTGRNTAYLMDPIYFAFQDFVMAHTPTQYPHSTVCFFHIYDSALHKQIRDYDNLEYKQVLDAVALFFLPDDSGCCCDVYHTSCSGPEDQTRIYIMEAERFPDWLKQQNGVQSHVGKFEKSPENYPTCPDG